MSLDKNNKLQNLKDGWWQNYQRLLVWMSLVQMLNTVSQAIHGARLGCYLTSCTDWDFTKANNYRFFNSIGNLICMTTTGLTFIKKV